MLLHNVTKVVLLYFTASACLLLQLYIISLSICYHAGIKEI